MSNSETPTVDIFAMQRRAQAHVRNERVGSVSAGLVLGGAAVLSKGLTRALLASAGTLLVLRGISGLSVRQMSTFVRNVFTHRADLERRFNDGEHDIVDAASFDSFPASDPPSYSPGAS